MRTWRDLGRAVRAGEESLPPEKDPWDWMLAPESAPPQPRVAARMKSFDEIIMEVNSDEEGSDWREGCEWCVGQHASPWEHYMFHRKTNAGRGRDTAQATGDTEPVPTRDGPGTDGRGTDNDETGGE